MLIAVFRNTTELKSKYNVFFHILIFNITYNSKSNEFKVLNNTNLIKDQALIIKTFEEFLEENLIEDLEEKISEIKKRIYKQ